MSKLTKEDVKILCDVKDCCSKTNHAVKVVKVSRLAEARKALKEHVQKNHSDKYRLLGLILIDIDEFLLGSEGVENCEECKHLADDNVPDCVADGICPEDAEEEK